MPGSERLRRWLALALPRWWASEGGPLETALSAVLAPAEAAYRGVIGLRAHAYERHWLPVHSAGIPVVSVGNLVVGGAGKTPVAAWVAERLAAAGSRPAMVLRGYGRDEVLVHQELNPGVPVFTDARRVRAVERAAGLGCDVAVVDDGYQHRSLARELDILLIAADGWRSRQRLLPRGPWRERLAAACRADFVLVTHKAAAPAELEAACRQLRTVAPGRPLGICRLEPTGLARLQGGRTRPLQWLAGERVLAVAALASPDPFVAHLTAVGAEVELAAFHDHHEYSATDASALCARAAGRTIVTTLKDAVKLRPLLDPAARVLVLRQRVVIEAGRARLEAALLRATAAARR